MKICIYGAALEDIDSCYKEETYQLGKLLALRGHQLIFGGGGTGLMGAAARGVKAGGGRITGVIPSFFTDQEAAYSGCDEILRPDTMRARKALMEEKCDSFVILPGGLGTLDEFFETMVLKFFGRQEKPIAVFNINGYYDKLWEFLQHGAGEGFIPAVRLGLCRMFEAGEQLLDYLEQQAGEEL